MGNKRIWTFEFHGYDFSLLLIFFFQLSETRISDTPGARNATKRMGFMLGPGSHICYHPTWTQGPHPTRTWGSTVEAVQSAQVPLYGCHPLAYIHNGRNRRLVFFFFTFSPFDFHVTWRHQPDRHFLFFYRIFFFFPVFYCTFDWIFVDFRRLSRFGKPWIWLKHSRILGRHKGPTRPSYLRGMSAHDNENGFHVA